MGIRPAYTRVHTHDHLHLPFIAAAAASINRTETAAHEGVLLCNTYSNYLYWQGHWLQNKYTNLLMPY